MQLRIKKDKSLSHFIIILSLLGIFSAKLLKGCSLFPSWFSSFIIWLPFIIKSLLTLGLNSLLILKLDSLLALVFNSLLALLLNSWLVWLLFPFKLIGKSVCFFFLSEISSFKNNVTWIRIFMLFIWIYAFGFFV